MKEENVNTWWGNPCCEQAKMKMAWKTVIFNHLCSIHKGHFTHSFVLFSWCILPVIKHFVFYDSIHWTELWGTIFLLISELLCNKFKILFWFMDGTTRICDKMTYTIYFEYKKLLWNSLKNSIDVSPDIEHTDFHYLSIIY